MMLAGLFYILRIGIGLAIAVLAFPTICSSVLQSFCT